jgi:hypothetical protein
MKHWHKNSLLCKINGGKAMMHQISNSRKNPLNVIDFVWNRRLVAELP